MQQQQQTKCEDSLERRHSSGAGQASEVRGNLDKGYYD